MVVTKGVITSKSQITIPKAVREAVGLEKGDEVIFVVGVNGQIIIRKMAGEEKAWLKIGEGSFSEWDNPEDAVYDNF